MLHHAAFFRKKYPVYRTRGLKYLSGKGAEYPDVLLMKYEGYIEYPVYGRIVNTAYEIYRY